MSKIKVVAIVGPTCTGKTALSIELADRFGGEIIACDSRTVYRRFDIGTAKPSAAERRRVPHHLLDVVEPEEEFTAALFAKLATEAIYQIHAAAKLPIICGGTGFYARALLEDIAIPEVPPQPQLREELQQFADRHGNEALHGRLAVLDLPTANRLNPNDRFRIIRALEVCIITGRPFSIQAVRREQKFRTLWIGLTVSKRENLKDLIALRLKEQIKSGLLEEVQSLYARHGSSHKLLHTVNYRDLVRLINKELSFEEAVRECERHNYQLARRQIQWFKANPEIRWFHVDEISTDVLVEQAALLTQSFRTATE